MDTAVVESLKALDPTRPIREADVEGPLPTIRFENVGWPVLILGAQ